MPKSRNRARGHSQPSSRQPRRFGRKAKWLAAIPLVALLLATFIGLFAAQGPAQSAIH